MKLLYIIIGAVLVNNFVMSQFLGICPFLGVSKKISTSIGMGIAVTFVMALASFVTWCIQYCILTVLNLEYMQTLAFILVIAVLVQVVEIVLKKVSHALYNALGVYLPLITTNCAVLGVTIINVSGKFNLMESVINGAAAAVGFSLALVLFAGIREKLSYSHLPKWMEGFPGALITAGIMAVSFMGFTGLILK